MFEGECGIYRNVICDQYAFHRLPDLKDLVSTINTIPKEVAINEVLSLRNMAIKQAPYPFTMRTFFDETPIEEAQKCLENTERFCRKVLEALWQ